MAFFALSLRVEPAVASERQSERICEQGEAIVRLPQEVSEMDALMFDQTSKYIGYSF